MRFTSSLLTTQSIHNPHVLLRLMAENETYALKYSNTGTRTAM